jgi:hypothetical protein
MNCVGNDAECIERHRTSGGVFISGRGGGGAAPLGIPCLVPPALPTTSPARKTALGGLAQPEITATPSLCSNPDLKGAREWLIDALARRALEIMQEQKQ